MHRSTVFALATGGALALAACGDSREPLATEGQLAQVQPGPGCNTMDAKSKARLHFGQPTQNAIAGNGGLIDLLIGSATDDDSTRYGFDVLERVELGQDVVGDAQTAMNLVNAILPCIKAGAPSIGPVGIFGSEGAFAIRGGPAGGTPTDARPVYSHDRFSAVAPPTTPALYDTWSEWLGLPDNPSFPDSRAIVYGTKLSVDPTTSREEEVGNVGFDWNTLPERTFPRPADGLLGMCVGGSNSTRIQSNHDTEEGILGFLDSRQPPLSLSCAGFNPDGTPKGSASLLRQAIDILSPQPLYAAALLTVGGTGGKPKGYSKKFVVLVTNAALRFQVQPSDEKIGDVMTPAVVVEAKTAAGTPIAGLAVSLQLRSNLGVPSSFQSGSPQTTNQLGIATFGNLVINSSGTYRLTASAGSGDEGMTVSQIVSNQFYIGTRSKK